MIQADELFRAFHFMVDFGQGRMGSVALKEMTLDDAKARITRLYPDGVVVEANDRGPWKDHKHNEKRK